MKKMEFTEYGMPVIFSTNFFRVSISLVVSTPLEQLVGATKPGSTYETVSNTLFTLTLYVIGNRL